MSRRCFSNVARRVSGLSHFSYQTERVLAQGRAKPWRAGLFRRLCGQLRGSARGPRTLRRPSRRASGCIRWKKPVRNLRRAVWRRDWLELVKVARWPAAMAWAVVIVSVRARAGSVHRSGCQKIPAADARERVAMSRYHSGIRPMPVQKPGEASYTDWKRAPPQVPW